MKKFISGISAAVLLATKDVVEAAAPEDCFATDTPLYNDRNGLEVITDQSKISELTVDHKMTKFTVCYRDTLVIGSQIEYGVYDAVDSAAATTTGTLVTDNVVTKVVQMPLHGTIAFDAADTQTTCKSIDFEEGNFIKVMVIYYSLSTITQIGVVDNKSVLQRFGVKEGQSNSGFVQFNNGQSADGIENFFGFATQETEEDVQTISGIGIIKYNPTCFNEYLVEAKVQAEKDEEERLAREAAEVVSEEERARIDAAKALQQQEEALVQ